MSSPLHITHAHGDLITVTDTRGGIDLLSYVYRPESAWEAPKPYLHPLRTPAGNVVTDYRPNDHRWHKGLQMTTSHLSGQNLWGGNTYIHGQGYQAMPERVGSMAHLGFDEVEAAGGSAAIAERLSWRHHDGTHWADEQRRIELHDVEYADEHGDDRTGTAGGWTLTWSSAITSPWRTGRGTGSGSPSTSRNTHGECRHGHRPPVRGVVARRCRTRAMIFGRRESLHCRTPEQRKGARPCAS